MKTLELTHPNDPDAAFARELERLLREGKTALADAIIRARIAWAKPSAKLEAARPCECGEGRK